MDNLTKNKQKLTEKLSIFDVKNEKFKILIFAIFPKNLKTYISLVYEILYQIIGAPASGSGQAGKRAVIPVRANQHSIDSNLESIEYLSSGQSCPLPSSSRFFLSYLLVSIPATGLLWFCFFKNFLLKFYFFA